MRWPFSAHLAVLAAGVVVFAASEDCRCFPGDACWPDDDVWSAFNASVGGRLIRTVPIGSVCHNPHYDEDACEELRKTWMDVEPHLESPSSIMSAPFVNQSCDPFTPREEPCWIGTYVQYSVNVTSASDIVETVRFAQEKNIRLVIKNTGHDYLGKSTGAGGLAIWTKHIRETTLVQWDDAQYTGPALRLGAGVMGTEAIAFGAQHDLVVVAGHCPSVGLAGHLQGGGHSPLSSKFGLAADNALEFEVVDGTGRLVTANRRHHSDLFWALRGGGGSTYGVVLSMTVKAHKDLPMAFLAPSFLSTGLDAETFYGAVADFHALVPTLVDAGCYPIWTFNKDVFAITELAAPGMTETQLGELLAPFTEALEAKKIVVNKQTTVYPTFKEYYDIGLAQWWKGQANNIQGGSWFIPRSLVVDPHGGKKYIGTLREILDQGAFVLNIGFNVSKEVAGDADSSVHPSWRSMLIDTVVGVPWDGSATMEKGFATANWLGNDVISKLQALAPGAGTYMSEAMYNDPHWKTNFYGGQYGKLLAIKNKYDPNQVFYAHTGVGSDLWIEQPDKRLCKVNVSEDHDSHVKDEL